MGCAWADWVTLGRHQRRQWQLLLQLELLDAVAFLKPHEPEWTMGEQEFLSISPDGGPGVSLLCRRDPVVTALVSTIDW
jgi:hypothetical protein